MGAFNHQLGSYKIDVSSAHNGNPPGRPPGFNSISGVYFQTESGWHYSVDRRLTGTWEVDPAVFVYDNGTLGFRLFGRKWVRTYNLAGNDEVVVAGFHKNGPSNSGLPWNISPIANVHFDSSSPENPYLLVEFQCGGGNYSIVINASR